MRQQFATKNSEKNLIENHANSDVYIRLKQVITTLPNDEFSLTCKQLLEAMGRALLRGENPEKLVQRIEKKRNRKTVCYTSLGAQEAEKDIEEIKHLRRLARARPLVPGIRKLERYHSEIMALHAAKASCRDIQFWLYSKKRLVVCHHSVQRYLNEVLSHEQKPDQSV